mgnify:CR=1 FL=1
MSEQTVSKFKFAPILTATEALQGREREIVDLVEATYRLHGDGDSVNPPSYFLRFPDRPTSRIIALPASIGGDVRVDGRSDHGNDARRRRQCAPRRHRRTGRPRAVAGDPMRRRAVAWAALPSLTKALVSAEAFPPSLRDAFAARGITF